MGTADCTAFAESTTLAEATRGQQPTGRRMRIKLIDAGWGSSGYYSPQVLKEAAKNGVFPAGTHMYLDHPTVTEQMDRPERSVGDLAAMTTGPATFAGDALYAEVQVFAPFQETLADKKDAIGVSIRAAGTAEPGEADGRTGPIITSLAEGISVDFVTRAGRGGQIVELLESARTQLREAASIGSWVESRIHLSFTQLADDLYGRGGLTRDERIALSNAIGDGLASFVSAVDANAPQLYQRALWDDAPEPDAVDTVSESHRPPVGAPPPGNHPLNEGKQMSGTTGAPAGGATDTDKTPADIAEAQNRVKALETELAEAREKLERRSDHAVRLQEAERKNARLEDEVARFRALESVRTTVATELAESGLPETAYARVTANVVGHEGANIPMTEAGTVDTDKLKTAIESAIKSEKSYVAGLLEAAGVGSVRGLGESTGAGDLSDEDADKELAEAMSGLGMSEAATRVAVTGRG